jgi:hypothetical protein
MAKGEHRRTCGVNGPSQTCNCEAVTLQRKGVVRWWIRNTATKQVLGSVQAASEDEAIGKAMVRWHVDTWRRDGLTAFKGAP